VLKPGRQNIVDSVQRYVGDATENVRSSKFWEPRIPNIVSTLRLTRWESELDASTPKALSLRCGIAISRCAASFSRLVRSLAWQYDPEKGGLKDTIAYGNRVRRRITLSPRMRHL
jgi:hypothetical protein